MYLIKWLEKGTSKYGEAKLSTTAEVHDYLADQGYSADVVRDVLELGSYCGTYDVVTMEEIKEKPAFIVLTEFGTLRVMKRPTSKVTKVFECRNEVQAYTILKHTALRISKYRYTYQVQYSLKKPENYWLKRWITKVTGLLDPCIELGDVKLLLTI